MFMVKVGYENFPSVLFMLQKQTELIGQAHCIHTIMEYV